MKDAIEHGREYDPSTMLRKLNATKNDLPVIQLLITIAKAYFPEGVDEKTGSLPNRFVGEIKSMYEANGYEVFLKEPGEN